jgi:hypothetical protein
VDLWKQLYEPGPVGLVPFKRVEEVLDWRSSGVMRDLMGSSDDEAELNKAIKLRIWRVNLICIR